MKQRIANYTVIIEEEKRLGTDKSCYSAQVPILGVATEADSLDKVQRDIKSLVEFHIKSLVAEGEKIPVETSPSLVTRFETILPKNAQVG